MAEQPVVERFRGWLREHELPVTAQRVAIAEIVLASDRHLSAEEVTVALARRGTKAGTATVYRTLDVLVASGLVVECDFAEGFRRFQPARERGEQEQLLCTSCGRVEAFRDDQLALLAIAAAEAHGFAHLRHRLVIYGECDTCSSGTRG
ncbi:MAG TPA: Fur family transcriptional regulator [Gemmatimonadaceae bacterium]|nr:Fur family transcriptional regulator [Gemmatimonadaceae bacterium]